MDYILGNRYALIVNFLIFIIVMWLYKRMSLFYMWEYKKDRERKDESIMQGKMQIIIEYEIPYFFIFVKYKIISK